QLRIATISLATRIHVRPDQSRVVPTVSELTVPRIALVIGPGPHTAAWSAAASKSWFLAGPPALAGTNAHRGLLEIFQCGSQFSGISHLLHELLQSLGGGCQFLRRARAPAFFAQLIARSFQMFGHIF